VQHDRWALLADKFVGDHYGSLRGRVRTHVINSHHLRTHLPVPPLHVVDVGGGAGHQSIPLAREGYEVTVVDPSPAMLERAEQLLAAEAPKVAHRISLVEASGEEAPASSADSDSVECCVMGDHVSR
jgi:S-adenosylmethionine-dependent methyltransferase